MCNPYFDADLALELAEHRWLVSHGWSWGVTAYAVVEYELGGAAFAWIPPHGHRGTQLFYTSRAHAVNSQKKNYPRGELHGKSKYGR